MWNRITVTGIMRKGFLSDMFQNVLMQQFEATSFNFTGVIGNRHWWRAVTPSTVRPVRVLRKMINIRGMSQCEWEKKNVWFSSICAQRLHLHNIYFLLLNTASPLQLTPTPQKKRKTNSCTSAKSTIGKGPGMTFWFLERYKLERI